MKSERHAACGTLIHRGGIVNILRNLGERFKIRHPPDQWGPDGVVTVIGCCKARFKRL
jgi:hypothetical protein